MEVNETNHTQVEAPQNETPEIAVATNEEKDVTTAPDKLTKAEIIKRLNELKDNAVEVDRQELEFLKLNFYKQNKIDLEAAKKAFVENGGEPEAFTPEMGPLELEFKTIMSSIKEQRNAVNAALEQEKEENLQKKLDILEKMKACTESSEDLNKNYQIFKELQQEWNDIKQVPSSNVTELWKS